MSTVKETAGLSDQAWATVFAVTAAVLTGLFIITAIGFASPEILHNAAHDIRHGLSFPCH